MLLVRAAEGEHADDERGSDVLCDSLWKHIECVVRVGVTVITGRHSIVAESEREI